MRQNRTSEWKVRTIWISRKLLLFKFECLDILCAWIGSLSENLWPFEFLESFHCSLSSVSIYYSPDSDISEKLWQLEFLESFCYPISSVSIYYSPESDIRGKSYDPLYFSRASIAQFRASWYIMPRNRTFEWKVMTIWISRELPLFNFERLDILFPRIGHPCEKLWPFEFI